MKESAATEAARTATATVINMISSFALFECFVALISIAMMRERKPTAATPFAKFGRLIKLSKSDTPARMPTATESEISVRDAFAIC